MVTQILEVQNQKGIHARVAAKIAQTAEGYEETQATLTYNTITVPLFSIMGLMMLSARKGAKVHIQATGDRAQSLCDALQSLFDGKFGEE